MFTLTAGRYLSNGFPSVSADIVLPLFVILIYWLSFISFHPAIILSQHTVVTLVTELRDGGAVDYVIGSELGGVD